MENIKPWLVFMLGFEFMLHNVSWPVDSFVVQNCCSSSVLEVWHIRLYQYMIMQITCIVSFNKFSWNLFLLSCRSNLSFSSSAMFYRCIGHSLHSCRFELMLCSKRWFGIVVVHWFRSSRLLFVGAVSTGMSVCRSCRQTISVCNQPPPRSTKPDHPFVVRHDECQWHKWAHHVIHQPHIHGHTV